VTTPFPTQRRLAFYAALAATSIATALLLFPLPVDPGRTVRGGDKWAHALLFAGLAACWAWAGWSPRRIMVAGVLFAGATECLQQVLRTRRHGDVLDALADIAGVSVVALACAWRRRRRPAEESTAR